MNLYKQNLLLVFLSIIFLCNCSSVLKKGTSEKYELFQTDTIQGYFFYEVNVPLKCFTRFDQIEQGNNLIFFDSLISEKSIDRIYSIGVFFYQYQPVIDQYINEKKIGLPQNKERIKAFNLAINYNIHRDDSLYNSLLYKDQQNILTYKKIYAKFSYINLGSLTQLVPNTKKYECCYSNKIQKINSFFIVDVIDFKIF